MKYLWLNWKDLKHPHSGGAERVNHSIMARLVRDGHEVTLLTSSFENASKIDEIDGVKIIRIGDNRYTHSFVAAKYYANNLKNKFDIIVEVVNTTPYFINVLKGDEKYYVFYHQLCRDVWFYESKFPLNVLGYSVLEPIANRVNAIGNIDVITVSNSTASDLAGVGFNREKMTILPENSESPRLEVLTDASEKEKAFTVLSLGALRLMKRPIEVLKAFNELYKKLPSAQLKIAGGGDKKIIKELEDFVAKHNLQNNVQFLGRVSEEEKNELMQTSHVFCMTSAYEGWGTTIIETANLGTPAIVYDRNGLRDAVVDGKTGFVVANLDYKAMAEKLYFMATNRDEYLKIRRDAYLHVEQYNPEATYLSFRSIVDQKQK